MSEQPTCGQGLAANAGLPAALGKVLAAMAQNLDVHQRALDLNDLAAQQEHEAYTSLVAEQDQIVAALETTARRMAGYRDLPMATHDMQLMTTPEVLQAFEAFVKAEEELLGLLQARIEQDRAMLAAIAGRTQGPT
jgi:uncharacterized protein Yka (UPF0111/DUF47 family)